jgi:hypothetical protein
MSILRKESVNISIVGQKTNVKISKSEPPIQGKASRVDFLD